VKHAVATGAVRARSVPAGGDDVFLGRAEFGRFVVSDRERMRTLVASRPCCRGAVPRYEAAWIRPTWTVTDTDAPTPRHGAWIALPWGAGPPPRLGMLPA